MSKRTGIDGIQTKDLFKAESKAGFDTVNISVRQYDFLKIGTRDINLFLQLSDSDGTKTVLMSRSDIIQLIKNLSDTLAIDITDIKREA